ncbi:glycosyltransferase family 4 protein [uncultured Roseivirga sp.]|uniref:glycosyltransferase family 4 protein n=1 Tax=uncultured Roseivirga sp. TaxID=543088 RepID=UPI0025871728|nr:glycosyltransferase family 4 protein [uncultured Roseivirga sp.]
MRILFLTYQGDMAGSTNSIAFLCRGLAKRGHQVYLGIRKESLLWQLVEDSNVVRVPMSFGGKFDLNNWKQIRDVVRQHRIELINAQSSHDRYTSIFANKFFGLGTKIVHTRRQMPLSLGGPVQRFLYNHWTDGIVAVSRQVKEELVKLGFNEANIKVIHNGTPTEKYAHIDMHKTEALRSKFAINENDFVLGCVSRIKNQIQIIKALAHVEQPVKMIFCGIEATEEMKEIIAGYRAAHQVFFEGHVEGDNILPYYKLFDAKILASTMEGLSQSLLEAMALKVPVIATAYAGNLDLIEDRENGLLFEDGDIEKIAELIQRVRSDQSLRNTLIANGKITALQKFNIDRTIANYEEYFQSLVTEN